MSSSLAADLPEQRPHGISLARDGVTLDQTDYNITAYDSGGGVIWQSEGVEFISRDWRMFLSGKSTITTPEDSFETDDTPVEFIFPGEEGFLASQPKYDCDALTAELPLWRASHEP